MLEMRSSAVLSALSVLPAESQWIAYVRTVAVNLSNVRVALPSNFITTGGVPDHTRVTSTGPGIGIDPDTDYLDSIASRSDKVFVCDE